VNHIIRETIEIGGEVAFFTILAIIIAFIVIFPNVVDFP